MQQRPLYIRFVGYLLIWALGLAPHLVQWEYAGLLNTLLWLAAAGVFFMGTGLVGRWVGTGGLTELGFKPHRGWLRHVAWGLLFGLVLTCLNYGARWFLGRFEITGWAPAGEVIKLSLWALVNALYSSLWEETLNRGFLLRVLPQRLPMGWTALVAALCFSGFHITKWGSPLSAWVFWFCSGLVLVLPYLLTRSLWFSAGLHWGQNFLVFALFEKQSVLQLTWNSPYPRIVDWTGTAVLLGLLPVVWLISRRLAERQVY